MVKLWLVGSTDVRFRLPLLNALRERGYDAGAVGSESETAFAGTGIPYWRFSLNRCAGPPPPQGSRFFRTPTTAHPSGVTAWCDRVATRWSWDRGSTSRPCRWTERRWAGSGAS